VAGEVLLPLGMESGHPPAQGDQWLPPGRSTAPLPAGIACHRLLGRAPFH